MPFLTNKWWMCLAMCDFFAFNSLCFVVTGILNASRDLLQRCQWKNYLLSECFHILFYLFSLLLLHSISLSLVDFASFKSRCCLNNSGVVLVKAIFLLNLVASFLFDCLCLLTVAIFNISRIKFIKTYENQGGNFITNLMNDRNIHFSDLQGSYLLVLVDHSCSN